MDSLKAWYDSDECQPLISFRKQCTSDLGMLIMVEGAKGLRICGVYPTRSWWDVTETQRSIASANTVAPLPMANRGW